MKFTYRRTHPQTSRTWFAQFPPHQHSALLTQLISWSVKISEASVLGTDQDRELWRTATDPDHKLWHRAQQHRNQPNTMLSVLAGSIDKLQRGADLTEKQLRHCENIALVMHHFGSELVEFTEVTAPVRSQSGLNDLRDNLFYCG